MSHSNKDAEFAERDRAYKELVDAVLAYELGHKRLDIISNEIDKDKDGPISVTW
jgi:predicted HD phosphohydrolase